MNLPKIPVGERLTLNGKTWLGTPSGPVELYIGNFIPVQAITDRDNINKSTLKQGTWCYVIDEDAVFKFIGTDWLPLEITGSTPATFMHIQSTPSDEWIIEHNFGYYPDVILMDEDGFEFKTQIQHVSSNKLIINLNAPEKGRAQLK